MEAVSSIVTPQQRPLSATLHQQNSQHQANQARSSLSQSPAPTSSVPASPQVALSQFVSPVHKKSLHTDADAPRLLYQFTTNNALDKPSNPVVPTSTIPHQSKETEACAISIDAQCPIQPSPTLRPLPPSPTSPNNAKTTSGIPRLIPSLIPRPTAPQRSSSTYSEPLDSNHLNSNNNNGSAVYSAMNYAQPYGDLCGDSTSSSILTSHPIVHPPPFVDPPELANNGTHQSRSRATTRSTNPGRMDRTASEFPQRIVDNESDSSSVFSSSGPPKMIGPKVNSLKNVHHKPAGGNVTIIDEKLKLGPIKSKCNSFANVKHKPGGGNVQIVDAKLDLSNAQPRVNSLQNARHVPSGGQVQIVSEKLEFDKTAKPKVGSLKNAQHRPGGGDVQIFKEALPWLKYNKPNLSEEEKARINKQRSAGHNDMGSSIHSGSTSHTSR